MFKTNLSFVYATVLFVFAMPRLSSAEDWRSPMACTPPSGVTASATSATCAALNSAASGGNTGKITLAGFGGTNRYQYSAGATFSAGAAIPASPTTIPGSGVIASALADPAVSQVYTIRIYDPIDNNCYTDIQTTLYHVNCGTICPGESYTLTAQSGLTSYKWYKDGALISGANSVTYIANSAGIYIYTGVDAVGCIVNQCQPVGLVPGCCTPLNINITGNLAACNAGTTMLTATGASGAAVYAWSTGATTSTLTAAAGTYTVTVTDGVCQTTRSATISNTNITASIAGNNYTCNGGTSTITATAAGAASFAWSNGGTSAAITVAAGTYTVTATTANGCTATASYLISNTTVTAAIAGAATACVTPNTVLTASGTGAVSYLWDNASTSASRTVSPSTLTTYTVTITGANGCTASAATTLKPVPVPSSIAASAALCAGESTDLTASGGVSYIWSTTQTINPITVTPPVGTTTYTVTATAANGCTATATVSVLVRDVILTTALTVVQPTTCGGTNGSITVNATGSSGTMEYRLGTGAWQASNVFGSLGAGNYVAQVRYVGGFCAFSYATAALVNPNPPTPATSGTGVICTGNATTLTASGAATYAWSNGINTATNTVLPTATTTYTVTATASTGCTATTSTTVVVNALPTPTVTGITNLFNGQSLTMTANGGASYVWNTGATTAAITVTPAATTIYTVTATNSNGCTASTTVTVTVFPTPTTTNTTICMGSAGTVTASGGTNYAWSNGQNTAAMTASPTATTTYTVTVTQGTASTTLTAVITVNPLPTPAIAGNNYTCNGGNTTLTASNTASATGNTYAWTGGGTSAAVTVAAGTYTVTVTNSNGCTATMSMQVTNTNITANISGPTNVCVGNSAVYTASGGTSYAWSNGASAATMTTNIAGTYTVTVTGANGCTNTSSITLVMTTAPTGVTASTTGTTCWAGATNNDGRITLAGFDAAHRYQYSTGSTFNSAAATPIAITTIPTGGVIATALPNPAVSQVYTIRVYSATNDSCYTDIQVTLMNTNCACPTNNCGTIQFIKN